MDIRSLSYFVVVAEELNITRAAAKLNMSQPPLSIQLRNLENELDTVLFIRDKKSLKLTESGELLYRRAKEILNLTAKAESEILSMKSGMTGTISLGLAHGKAQTLLGKWLVEFNKSYPKVKYRIIEGNSDDLVEKLRSGLISIAVITEPCDHSLLNNFPVGREKLAVSMSANHPLAKEKGDIELSELVGEPLIVPRRGAAVDMIYKWFRQIGSEPNIVCEADSFINASMLSDEELGVSVFPKSEFMQGPHLVTRELAGDDKYINYLFVWRKGRPLPTIEEHFIDLVKDRSKQALSKSED